MARAVDILVIVAEGPQTLGQIAARAQLSKATTHRLLAALGHRSLIIQDSGTGNYSLGPGCIALADAVVRGTGRMGVVARPYLTELSALTRETVTMHVRVGTQRFCIDEVPSPHPIRFTSGIGVAEPIHTGSAGKILLAFAPAAVREQLLSSLKLVALTKNTIVDRRALDHELEGIRAVGYAVSHGERVDGASGVSVPIFDADGVAMAALSILGPSTRIDQEPVETFLKPLGKYANEISVRMLQG